MIPLILLSMLSVSAPKDASEEAGEQIVEKIVAVVGGDIILLSEVENVLDEMLRAMGPGFTQNRQQFRSERRAEIINTLIAEKVLEQEIHKLRIEVSDQELDRAIEDILSKNNIDKDQLRMALRKQGLSLKEYREGMKKQLLKAKIIQLKVRSRIQVTDQDVQSAYATMSAQASQLVRIRAQHILFIEKRTSDDVNAQDSEAKQKALAALRRAQAGEDFGLLAGELSEGPSRARQGDLGTFGRGEMMPEFEEAAFKAKEGHVVGPVRTSIGWHVIKVNERVVEAQRPIEEVEMAIRQQLYEAKVEDAFARYIEELKGQVYIEIRDTAS